MIDNSSHTTILPKPWIYHSLFWLAYYVFAALISLTIHHIDDPRFYLQLLTLVPPDMGLVYLHLFLLRRFLLKKRNIPLYTVLILAGMSANALINISLHRLYGNLGSVYFAGSGVYSSQNFAGHILNCIYLLALATAAKFTKDWVLQKQRLQEIEKTQIATELAFLRSQIQPHFFFNTLNNLYSLTLQKSDLAPEIVLKLASLMSYMLYESGAPLVPLQKEIGNLENYIGLEQLRFGSRLSLSFEKKGPMESVHIPPLLLLAFVENSFKHGIAQITGEGRIDILIQVDPGQFIFSIHNPIGTGRSKNTQGIGLKNAMRRLDLLYGSRYALDVHEADHNFYVTLKIPLP